MAQLAPWQADIDNIRRTLTKLEMEMMDCSCDPLAVSVYLTSIECASASLAGNVCDEIGSAARTAVDIAQLSAVESVGLLEQL